MIASSAQWKTMITTGLLMGVLAGAMGTTLVLQLLMLSAASSEYNRNIVTVYTCVHSSE